MDSVKLAAVFISIAFLVAFVVMLNVKTLLLTSVNQINQLRESLGKVKISSVSSSPKNITLSIYNPFNVSIYIYNVSGPYVTLDQPVKVSPNTTEDFVILITNPGSFYNLANARQENITLYMGLGNFNFTQVVNI
ncbi:hypothetical protein GWK48_06460 [Metallosphaera tengchongensis]|uniref:Uncharacterized protein n=1 Tax=Metallosphaera tengchongensis TaxID=1532350 RepID=A0A6N0NTP1_9CREN|nr:hypothetical protein [Metallosphaera tengchongensis]QKR00062.1 hypothetical protein GWK48_06460 [Metallosphaera tengchongensis]